MKKKADINIGKRADLAVHQMFPDYDDQTIAKIIGCHRHIFFEWRQGKTPSGFYLQRMCSLGADIDWILTGRSKRK